jgi:ureidoglycolate dehydrogenase (NAD+)
MMIDLLAGALNGMAFGPRLAQMYEELDRPQELGHFVLALDPHRFAGGATLEATVQSMTEDVVRIGGDVQAPGDPEARAERERRRDGIPFEPQALADLRDWSRRLAVPFPDGA